jgi:toxin ParE1/3/4
MIETYSIKWTFQAEADLDDIILFIAEENPERALRLSEEIKNKVNKLSSFPDRGRSVPEFKELGITLYREIIFKVWRVIYKIQNDIVFIYAVLDSRRNLEAILLERLTR